MFYNLASNNASYFEENINVLITLCSFFRHDFKPSTSVINYIHMHAHKYVMEPFIHQFAAYQANGPHIINRMFFGGCVYKPFLHICNFVKSHVVTKDYTYDDHERAMVQQGHYPAGGSIRDWHYLLQQHYSMPKIFEFDFGPRKNMMVYRQKEAPEVDLYKT